MVLDLQGAGRGRRERGGLSVELLGVEKRFGDFSAVREVSLTVRAGEFLSILGSSGSGKTTTLRMIGGFETPSRGRIIIGGRDVTHAKPNRRPTNMVFQRLALFPHLNVSDNVAFGLRMRRVPGKEISKSVNAILDMVGLGGFERRAIRELSGGQQQRVAVARALVNDPEVLLLDEPLGALDLALRIQMQAELKALHQRLGTTFIYVTHDQTEAFAMSDRIAVMHGGLIEQVASVEEIYARPTNEFVARFVGGTNIIPCWQVSSHQGSSALIWSDGALAQCESGRRAIVSVRPERLRMGRVVDPRWETSKAARILDVVFSGGTITYRLEDSSGLALSAMVANNQDGIEFEINEPVVVGWCRGDGVVLEERRHASESEESRLERAGVESRTAGLEG